MDPNDSVRPLIRHLLATIAYRGAKTLRGAPAGFENYLPAGARNTPLMLLSHINDLLEWSERWCCENNQKFITAQPAAWEAEVARFHAVLDRLDAFLASGSPLTASVPVLFQAPLADVLTHVGQIALLRRMAGSPVTGEAYRVAPIAAGRVGPDQAPPGREFEPGKGAIWSGPAE